MKADVFCIAIGKQVTVRYARKLLRRHEAASEPPSCTRSVSAEPTFDTSYHIYPPFLITTLIITLPLNFKFYMTLQVPWSCCIIVTHPHDIHWHHTVSLSSLETSYSLRLSHCSRSSCLVFCIDTTNRSVVTFLSIIRHKCITLRCPLHCSRLSCIVCCINAKNHLYCM